MSKTVHVHSWSCEHVNRLLGRHGWGLTAESIHPDCQSTRLAFLLNQGLSEREAFHWLVADTQNHRLPSYEDIILQQAGGR